MQAAAPRENIRLNACGATPMEHRWGNRLLVDLPVLLRRRDQRAGEGRLIEASVSGALIRTDLKLRDLTPVEVLIDGESVTASVIRHTSDGAIALEWSELAPRRVMTMLKSPDRVTIDVELEQEWPVQT
jgi:hypothetical protein